MYCDEMTFPFLFSAPAVLWYGPNDIHVPTKKRNKKNEEKQLKSGSLDKNVTTLKCEQKMNKET